MPDDPKQATRGANRRKFLAGGAVTALAAQAGSARGQGQASDPIRLPTMKARTEMQSGPPPSPISPDQRVGFAIVGLGELALGQVLPAFGQCRFARLAALVSGD